MGKIQMNQFSMTPMKGAVAALLNDLTLSCQVDPASVATLVAGTKVKLTNAVGNTIMIDAALASDEGVGFVLYTPKKDKFVAGDPVEIGFSLSVMWGEASGSITRGDQLNSVATGAKLETSAGDPVCGVALENAADGDIFRYLVLVPMAIPATITSGSINGVAIGGSTPAAGTFTTLTATGAATFDGLINAAGSSFGVVSKRIRTSIANVNAGATLLAAVTGRKWRLVEAKVIAIGANVTSTTATGVAIIGTQSASGVNLLTVAKADLTRSAVNSTEVNGTVLADGASFVDNDADTAITIAADGGTDLAGASNIDVIITASLE